MQTAILVDVGYLHAQASVCLTQSKQPRHLTHLELQPLLEHLSALGRECAPGMRLLRIYWYDGIVRSGRLTSEQEQVASAQNCKLRLGLVNARGEQKGVDALLVTDLVELARNRAVSDVVLVAGDEDIRIGVEIAQTHGVRVHLLGIKPARSNQSPDLINAVDTHHEWGKTELDQFFSYAEPAEAAAPVYQEPSAEVEGFEAVVTRIIEDRLDEIEGPQLENVLSAFRSNSSSVPQEIDRACLAALRSAFGRDLDDDEKRKFRDIAKAILREEITS